MLVSVISNDRIPIRSPHQWNHLPAKLRWKAKELVPITQDVVRNIIFTPNIDINMRSSLRCDLYDVHLKLPREACRPVSLCTLSYIRRMLRTCIDFVSISQDDPMWQLTHVSSDFVFLFFCFFVFLFFCFFFKSFHFPYFGPHFIFKKKKLIFYFFPPLC